MASLKTAQGEELSFKMNGKHNITVWDKQGNMAIISVYDVGYSVVNGAIHVIDKALMP